MARTTFGLDLLGDARAHENYASVANRLDNQPQAWREVLELLEERETIHFIKLRGKYVDSGDLAASLTTESAQGAIRDVHGDGRGLDFGTSVFYGRFLTKRRKDPSDGQVSGRKRKGKSAVLVLTPKTRKDAAQTVLRHVMEPVT